MGRGTTLGVYLKAISSSGSLLLLLLLHFHEGIITGASAAFSSTQTKTEQKCDKVVLVETLELLSYLGNVTFTAPIPFQGRWTTYIKFTSPYTFIGGWGVEVQSFGRKGYAVFERNEKETVNEGDQVIFQFRVLYGRNAKVPKVLSIRWENISICGAPILQDASYQLAAQTQNKAGSANYEDDNDDANERTSDSESTSSASTAEIIQQHIATNNVRVKEFTEKTD